MRYVFAGDAQGRAGYVRELEALIDKAGLKGVAALVGHCADMPAAFLAAAVVAVPSTEPEAFGRGAVEAQAMGVPVIASNMGGFTETIVEGETGFLAPPGIAVALASVLERLIDFSPQAREAMGRLGQSRARSLYSTAALQEATLAVYQRLLRTGEARAAGNAQSGMAL